MILIFSIDGGDGSTSPVMDWITYLGADRIRVNVGNLNKDVKFSIHLEPNGITTEYRNMDINFSSKEVSAVWFRREERMFSGLDTSSISNIRIKESVDRFLQREVEVIKQALYLQFDDKVWLCDPSSGNLNKINALQKACDAGIRIPTTLITNKRTELERFKNKHRKIICKCFRQGGVIQLDGSTYGMHTEILSDDIISSTDDVLFPAFVQEYIPKKYELRIFFIESNFFPMAIFSQNDPQTSVDFRKYNYLKPNRNTPYILPHEIQEKLKTLMLSLKLNTGSIDMIRATDGSYVFLEVNPGGQFGMVSEPCNYYLEKRVAEYLINQSKKYYESKVFRN